MKKILLVDDHAFLRDALADVMARAIPDLQVLQADDLRSARSLLGQHVDVDLLLLDLQLPDGDGMDAIASLLAAGSMRLVVMSADQRPDTIRRALDAGAAGYLPKSLQAAAMLDAVQEVLQGGIYVPVSALAAPVLDEAMNLSPRQRDVLGLLIEGVSNKVIARELAISEATVKSHVAAIMGRFDVTTRTQVVVAVARRGWRMPHRRRSNA